MNKTRFLISIRLKYSLNLFRYFKIFYEYEWEFQTGRILEKNVLRGIHLDRYHYSFR